MRRTIKKPPAASFIKSLYYEVRWICLQGARPSPVAALGRQYRPRRRGQIYQGGFSMSRPVIPFRPGGSRVGRGGLVDNMASVRDQRALAGMEPTHDCPDLGFREARHRRVGSLAMHPYR